MEIRDFFHSYEKALTDTDAETVATCYAKRFTMSSKDGYELITTEVSFLKQAALFYKSIGVVSSKIKTYEETDLGSLHTLVTILWGYEDADGSEIIDFDVTYIVKLFEDTPKIVFLVNHNERERLGEKGLLPK